LADFGVVDQHTDRAERFLGQEERFYKNINKLMLITIIHFRLIVVVVVVHTFEIFCDVTMTKQDTILAPLVLQFGTSQLARVRAQIQD